MAATTGHTSSLPTEEDLARYGVIGHPISHSLSPLIHRYFARQTNQPLSYTLVEAPEVGFESVAGSFFEQGGAGLNVTLPFKQQAYALVDKATPAAELAGAVNTIRRSAAGLEGHNTDGAGLVQDLEHNLGWSLGGARILLIGAGGASRAVVASLLDAGVPQVFITNRTRIRAEKLASDLGHRVKVVDWVHAPNMLDDASLLVNTTSLGMVGKAELRMPLDGLRPDMVVNDLVYTPLKTRLLEEAEAAGCTSIDGLGMLLHQAVPGFERWFGKRPVVDNAARNAALR